MILLTGGTGFVGTAVRRELAARGLPFRHAVRSAAQLDTPGSVLVGDIDGATGWDKALQGVSVVLHVAGLAHQFGRAAADAARFDRVNVEGTDALARAAVANGVERLVFLSTAKVSRESSGEALLTEEDEVHPEGPYAVSKWRAEQRVREVSTQKGLECVIVRTPLVYGPGVRANFLSLFRAVNRGVPLPFGSIRNRRSLIFVENLADALLVCSTHPAAGGHTFFVKDGPDLSTPDLVRAMAASLHRPARLVAVPERVFRGVARVLGRQDAVGRLIGSLAVDDRKIRSILGWTAPHSMESGLARTAAWLQATTAGDQA